MPKQKILYIIGQLGIGGAEKQLILLAKNLNRDKYLPIICSLSTNTELKYLLAGTGIKLIVIPESGSPDISRFFKILRMVRREAPDLIHSYLFVANTWARIVGSIYQIPVIISIRSVKSDKPFYMKFIDRILSSLGSYMIVNSKEGADLVLKMKEFNKEKIQVIYNGYDEQQFDYSKTRKELLDELGIPAHHKVIGMVGRFSPVKNPIVVIKSFYQLSKKYNNLSLLFVGDGELFPSLCDLAVQLHIKDKVIFAGQRNDMGDIYKLIDVLVLASIREGFPNVMLEAMYHCIPVLATPVGGIPEIIDNGWNGVLVPVNDIGAMSNGIERILSNDEFTKRITDNASQTISELTIQDAVAETEAVYQKLLEASKNPRRN